MTRDEIDKNIYRDDLDDYVETCRRHEIGEALGYLLIKEEDGGVVYKDPAGNFIGFSEMPDYYRDEGSFLAILAHCRRQGWLYTLLEKRDGEGFRYGCWFDNRHSGFFGATADSQARAVCEAFRSLIKANPILRSG
ncbi:MAG: hypothetical protein GY847_01635 [Proteobacteria bacterium]|nr:hypothetical protein [Pseudomonadota bacterium]